MTTVYKSKSLSDFNPDPNVTDAVWIVSMKIFNKDLWDFLLEEFLLQSCFRSEAKGIRQFWLRGLHCLNPRGVEVDLNWEQI